MDDRQDKILTAGPYELADDYHARILGKVSGPCGMLSREGKLCWAEFLGQRAFENNYFWNDFCAQ